MKTDTTIHGWQDFVELCIASWIFVSPFFLGFFDNISASLSCMFLGGLVISLSIFGMAKESPKLEWASLFVAIVFMASPWLFGYAEVSVAVFNAVISSGLLILFSTLAMIHEYKEASEEAEQSSKAGHSNKSPV